MKTLTPSLIAERYAISVDKVLGWIRSGELRGINVATSPTGRPRYRIDLADLEAFEARRAAVPAPKAKRRRRNPSSSVVEFF